jgi:hypothetical protein
LSSPPSALRAGGGFTLSGMSSQELEYVEAPEGQKRTAVWRHPDRDMIHALLYRGKSAGWISEWLEERYPLEDEYGQPHANAVEHRKWHISDATISKYRREWLPEAEPGVDVVHGKLQKLIGYQTPAPNKQLMELDVLEALVAVGQMNLAKAIQQDDDMGMVQPITLEAHKVAVDTVVKRAKLAQDLSVEGYEQKPKELLIQQHLQQTNTNLNVNADVTVDGATGKVVAQEPKKLQLMRQLMDMEPEKAKELVHTAQHAAENGVAIEGTAEEIDADEPPPDS